MHCIVLLTFTVFETRKLRQKVRSSRHLSLAKKVRKMALKSFQRTYLLHFIVYLIICSDLPVYTKTVSAHITPSVGEIAQLEHKFLVIL